MCDDQILFYYFTITYNIIKLFTYTYLYISYSIVCILNLHHLVHIIFSTLEKEEILFIYSFSLVG